VVDYLEIMVDDGVRPSEGWIGITAGDHANRSDRTLDRKPESCWDFAGESAFGPFGSISEQAVRA
jgi:hypothetical protein